MFGNLLSLKIFVIPETGPFFYGFEFSPLLFRCHLPLEKDMNLHPMIFISKFGWYRPSDTLFTIFIIFFFWFVHSIDYN